jgi:hypothetical protein
MTDLAPRKLRVFLCHSSQDKPTVHWLNDQLSAEGWVEPWLDELKLLPGQNWTNQIGKAVEASDAVIVCLSNYSVNKEGFVQKEISYALEIALGKPLYTTFLVIVRFDECPIPQNLRASQYIDLFPKENMTLAYNRLSASLAFRAQELGINLLKVDLLPHILDIESKMPEIQQETPRVFISYSRKDIDFVKNLAIDLQTVGLDVWWDISGLQGGNNWVRSIQDALDKSKYCIVVITPDSINSTWVEKEYTYAMNNNITVIPLFLKDCKLPFSFSTIQYIDFRESRYRPALRELYSALNFRFEFKY